MAEDTHDQGTPSALRPRAGWDKSARNPEAIHGNLDPSTVPSSGYADPSYQPPGASSQPQSDAGELDQSPYKEAQQGHRLARTNSPSKAASGGLVVSDGAADMDGTPRADGRPAWDPRFHLERTAWEAQPRTTLLRPPSSNAFPGAGGGISVRRSNPALYDGRGGCSDSGSPGRAPEGEASGSGGLNGTTTDGYGSRTTILPGLYATSPPVRLSPYCATGEPQSPGPAKSPAGPSPKVPHTDLADSYIGRAYSPDQSQLKGRGYGGSSVDGSGGGGGSGGGSSSTGGRAAGGPTDGADADDEGGVDGHGTHLPSLDRAYLGKPAPSDGDKGKKAGSGGSDGKPARPAQIPGAAYLPKGRNGEPVGPPTRKLATIPPPLSLTTPRHYYGMDGEARVSAGGGTRDAGWGGGGGGTGGLGGVWRPSGRQPIPEAAPPVSRTPRGGEEKAETQEEADRRRAAPRDPALYSPDRYPVVGQGWFMAQEKFPPNPVYAGVKAKYLEARQKPETDEDKHTMPDIHTKPWLTPGKHLVTDSSVSPPKMNGTAGARPSYAFSPSATGNSGGMGTLRSNKGTARSGRGGGKGGKKKRGGSGGSSGSEIEGDREVLAVIGGVRLMSIIRRDKMADEARLEAEEDAQMAAEDEPTDDAGGRRREPKAVEDGAEEEEEPQQQQQRRQRRDSDSSVASSSASREPSRQPSREQSRGGEGSVKNDGRNDGPGGGSIRGSSRGSDRVASRGRDAMGSRASDRAASRGGEGSVKNDGPGDGSIRGSSRGSDRVASRGGDGSVKNDALDEPPGGGSVRGSSRGSDRAPSRGGDQREEREEREVVGPSAATATAEDEEKEEKEGAPREDDDEEEDGVVAAPVVTADSGGEEDGAGGFVAGAYGADGSDDDEGLADVAAGGLGELEEDDDDAGVGGAVVAGNDDDDAGVGGAVVAGDDDDDDDDGVEDVAVVKGGADDDDDDDVR